MSFALPIAFTLAALTLPIVALYILKVRLRRVSVSTNLFWKQIYDEKPPRSVWQNFRHLISLLLQLLLLRLLRQCALHLQLLQLLLLSLLLQCVLHLQAFVLELLLLLLHSHLLLLLLSLLLLLQLVL